MVIMKLLWHIKAFLLKIIYQIINQKRVCFGKETTFRSRFNLVVGRKGKIVIGNNCFFNNDCSINALNAITIGDGSIFGENVKIYDHNHRFVNEDMPIKEQGYSVGTVTIGKHCWIGSNVVILKGAKIEDNCVIGAGCIVDGLIPRGSILKRKNEYCIEKIGGRKSE